MSAWLVQMPKATVHQNYFFSAGKYNIWLSGKKLAVNSKTISQRKQRSPDGQFWFCVSVSDAAHPF